MKNIFSKWLLFFLFHGMPASADIFVHAPELRTHLFRSFLQSTQSHSLTQYFRSKTRIQDLDSIPIDKDVGQLHSAIQQMNSLPWLSTEAEVFLNLVEKIPAHEISAQERNQALSVLLSNEKLQFEYPLLFQSLKKSGPTESSFYSDQELSSLQKWQTNSEELLFVDGVVWNTERRLSRGIHHWLLLSDAATPVLKLGALDEFLTSISYRTAFEPTCQSGLVLWKQLSRFSVTNLGSRTECLTEEVLFNADLQSSSRAQAPVNQRPPMLWLTSVAVVSTAIIANSMHGKRLSIHWPVFKF
jgi:hypothetical protein